MLHMKVNRQRQEMLKNPTISRTNWGRLRCH